MDKKYLQRYFGKVAQMIQTIFEQLRPKIDCPLFVMIKMARR